jgi:hypothetical protein
MQPDPYTPAGSDPNRVRDEISGDMSAANRALHDTKTEITDKANEIAGKAGDLASDAKEAVAKQAEVAQHTMGENLSALGGALRAAGDRLEEQDQTMASNFVRDAAGGLERLSTSIKKKPFQEIVHDVRSFGRNNPTALIAGSVLAGLALGRLLRSTAPDNRGSGYRAGSPARRPMDRAGAADQQDELWSSPSPQEPKERRSDSGGLENEAGRPL